jgi:uncharacterized glyoxalase superfamily protein PhnB
MKMVRKLMCVNITSKDSKRLADFYRAIGVPIYVNDEDYDGWFLGNSENEGCVTVWDENKWGPSCAGFITMVFEVDDLEETYEKIISQGIAINPPRTADWGGQELTLKDPDGNIIMFL